MARLIYQFNIPNAFAMAGLGLVFGKAAASVHNFREIPSMRNEKLISVVMLNSGQGLGKTTFARAALEGMIQGHAYERDQHSLSFMGMERPLAWMNITLPFANRQHRLYDVAMMDLGRDQGKLFAGLPQRRFGGVDYVEGILPGSSKDVVAMVNIVPTSEVSRDVKIEFLNSIHENLLISAGFPGEMAGMAARL